MDRFHVRIISMTGRPFLVAEWRDPASGKLKRKSTGHKVRREAERYAAKLEKQLNDGEFIATAVRWDDFRVRYEEAHADRWAPRTKDRVKGMMTAVEREIAPKFLRSVDAAAIASIVRAMRKAGNTPATIGAHLRHLKAALRWAARKNLLGKVPDIEMPQGAIVRGGRAISGEEFERMLEVVPAVLAEGKARLAQDPESWRYFLRLLWVSGLRIGEALKLHWTEADDLTPLLGGKIPRFQIQSRASKNRKTQTFPMAPEAFGLLSGTPEGERTGFVSNPVYNGRRAKYMDAVIVVSAIGRKAWVIVARKENGDPVYCTAHDLRRSAATRWAARVMPSVLQAMMRHASPATTAKFYTDGSGDPIAAAAWEMLGGSAYKAAGIAIESTITTGEQIAADDASRDRKTSLVGNP